MLIYIKGDDDLTKGIIFFSKSNNTKFVAEYLSSQIDAKTIELIETESRKGLIGFIKSGYQASRQKKSNLIGTPWDEIEMFDEIYLMTPVWAGNGTPAINAFLDKVQFMNKKVNIVTLQSDPKENNNQSVHIHLKKRILENGGNIGSVYALHSAGPGKFAGEEYLKEEVNGKILDRIL